MSRWPEPGTHGHSPLDGAIPTTGDATSPAPDDDLGQFSTDYVNLQRRLETMPVIEQAKGILIGRFGIDADTAFEVLRRWSSHTNQKLRDISRLLVDAAAQQADAPIHPVGPGRSPTALDLLFADFDSGAPSHQGGQPLGCLNETHR
ncbi:MAG TPA: ANTAR domain-containing protein [Microlunatus sp.]|nr:ANTAR domain-containing protein [Microlunatus sp.]